MCAPNQPQAHPRISSKLPQTQHQNEPRIMCRLTPEVSPQKTLTNLMIAKSAPNLLQKIDLKNIEILYAFDYDITFAFH